MNNTLNNLISTLIALTLICGISSSVLAKDYTIALSPYVEATQAKSEAVAVIKFITSLEGGDEITVIDGFHIKTIATFNIPTKAIYNSPKARLNYNKKAVGQLMQFAKSNEASFPAPRVAGALKLPQLFRFIADNAIGETEVIILGSPLHDDPREALFSMHSGIYPSDVHIKYSRDKTPFGAWGLTNGLKDIRIHMVSGDDQQFTNDQRKFKVQRFWTLFIESRGGQLVSFVGDLPTLFKRVKNKAKAPTHDFKLNDSGKLEMIRLNTQLMKQSIHTRPLSTQPLSPEQTRRGNRVQIGLSWSCKGCDLDLMAKAHPSAQTLYYGNKQSTEGSYWKDYVDSPQSSKGYETIAFDVPVDLNKLRLAVNFYAGVAPHGLKGEIRLSVDGQTYASNFTLSAKSGNRGIGIHKAIKTGQADGKHNIIIDPLRIVAL